MSAIEYSPARYSASPRRLFEHAVDSFRLVAEALLRVLRLALVEMQEVMRLPQVRADARHLQHEPLHHLPTRLAAARELPGFVAEIEQDRAGLHQREPRVVVDDRGYLVVRADLQELGCVLLARVDVDRDRAVRHPDLLEHDRHLAAVRCGPGVQIDHRLRDKSAQSHRAICGNAISRIVTASVISTNGNAPPKIVPSVIFELAILALIT